MALVRIGIRPLKNEDVGPQAVEIGVRQIVGGDHGTSGTVIQVRHKSKRVALEFVSDCSVSILGDSNESIRIQVKESATSAML